MSGSAVNEEVQHTAIAHCYDTNGSRTTIHSTAAGSARTDDRLAESLRVVVLSMVLLSALVRDYYISQNRVKIGY